MHLKIHLKVLCELFRAVRLTSVAFWQPRQFGCCPSISRVSIEIGLDKVTTESKMQGRVNEFFIY